MSAKPAGPAITGPTWASLALALAVLLAGSGCTLIPGQGRSLPTADEVVAGERTDALPSAAPAVEATPRPTSTPAPWVTPIAPLTTGPAGARPTSTPALMAAPVRSARPMPPKILHNVEGSKAVTCLGCHRAGRFGVPPDHLRRKIETCLGCHFVDYSAVKVKTPVIPHSVVGREGCLTCHVRAVEGARPMPGEHTKRSESTCRNCHEG